jgi:hypothetical protein
VTVSVSVLVIALILLWFAYRSGRTTLPVAVLAALVGFLLASTTVAPAINNVISTTTNTTNTVTRSTGH